MGGLAEQAGGVEGEDRALPRATPGSLGAMAAGAEDRGTPWTVTRDKNRT